MGVWTLFKILENNIFRDGLREIIYIYIYIYIYTYVCLLILFLFFLQFFLGGSWAPQELGGPVGPPTIDMGALGHS